MIDLTLAFPDAAAATAWLIAKGYLITSEKGAPHPAPGVSMTPLPGSSDASPIVFELSPAEFGDKGNITKEAEIDPRYFVLLRLTGQKLAAETAGKPQVAEDGKQLKIADRTAIGTEFKKGETEVDAVTALASYVDADGAELIDETTWPNGPPRVWQ